MSGAISLGAGASAGGAAASAASCPAAALTRRSWMPRNEIRAGCEVRWRLQAAYQGRAAGDVVRGFSTGWEGVRQDAAERSMCIGDRSASPLQSCELGSPAFAAATLCLSKRQSGELHAPLIRHPTAQKSQAAAQPSPGRHCPPFSRSWAPGASQASLRSAHIAAHQSPIAGGSPGTPFGRAAAAAATMSGSRLQSASAGPAGDSQEQEEELDLDALLDQYEQQAAADAAAVQRQQQQQGAARKRQKLSSAEQREEALSQPIGADNKCAGPGCMRRCIVRPALLLPAAPAVGHTRTNTPLPPTRPPSAVQRLQAAGSYGVSAGAADRQGWHWAGRAAAAASQAGKGAWLMWWDAAPASPRLCPSARLLEHPAAHPCPTSASAGQAGAWGAEQKGGGTRGAAAARARGGGACRGGCSSG